MKTDYKNLKAFDCAAIFVLFIGIALIGLIVFNLLTTEQRRNVALAISFFDLHEQAKKQVDTVDFILSVPDEFLAQFYLAFNQTMSFPDNIEPALVKLAEVKEQVESYSDVIASNYLADNTPEEMAYEGSVLGAFIENGFFTKSTEQARENQAFEQKTDELEFYFHFTPPKLIMPEGSSGCEKTLKN